MQDNFAERVGPLEAEGAYAVLARAKALEAQGRSIIHLEIGQPDFPTPAPVAEAGIEAIRAGRTRYTPPAGTSDLRASIAESAGAQRGLSFQRQRGRGRPGRQAGHVLRHVGPRQSWRRGHLPRPRLPLLCSQHPAGRRHARARAAGARRKGGGLRAST